MAKFITAQEAAALITDGATVGVGGMGLSGWPEGLGLAIRDRFKETGHPKGLILKQGSAMGDWGYGNNFIGTDRVKREDGPDNSNGIRGITRLGEAGPGLVAEWTAAHIGSAFALCDLARANELACWCLPQGVIVNLWREIGAGRPGLITKTGLGTFVDPRIEAGRMNKAAAESGKDVVKLIEFDGEEYLFYPSFKVDFALLRGTIADEHGNISFDHESVINEGFAVANAAHHCGGKVIVQVEYIAKAESLNPKDIKIPCNLVDYVVWDNNPMHCWQAEGDYWEPSFSGQLKKPLNAIGVLPFDDRKVILRRAAMELKDGNIVNMGVGMPAEMAKVINEEGKTQDVILSSESGMIGGVPSALPSFGSAYNAEAIISHNEMFDMIHGGALDVTCLGIGEIDKDGNNNVSRMGTRLTGPGGFVDITRATKKVIFVGTLFGTKKIKKEDGTVEYKEYPKFVDTVGQISFSGKYSPKEQSVMYITERAVFKLIDNVITLVEIAPGMDLEKDIFSHMGFRPAVAADLKEMPAEIFQEKWGKLASYMEAK